MQWKVDSWCSVLLRPSGLVVSQPHVIFRNICSCQLQVFFATMALLSILLRDCVRFWGCTLTFVCGWWDVGGTCLVSPCFGTMGQSLYKLSRGPSSLIQNNAGDEREGESHTRDCCVDMFVSTGPVFFFFPLIKRWSPNRRRRRGWWRHRLLRGRFKRERRDFRVTHCFHHGRPSLSYVCVCVSDPAESPPACVCVSGDKLPAICRSLHHPPQENFRLRVGRGKNETKSRPPLLWRNEPVDDGWCLIITGPLVKPLLSTIAVRGDRTKQNKSGMFSSFSHRHTWNCHSNQLAPTENLLFIRSRTTQFLLLLQYLLKKNERRKREEERREKKLLATWIGDDLKFWFFFFSISTICCWEIACLSVQQLHVICLLFFVTSLKRDATRERRGHNTP